MSTRKPFRTWIDEQLAADPELAKKVDSGLRQIRAKRQLQELREARRLSQADVGTLTGVSQPAVAKTESEDIANIKLGTLVKFVSAMGGKLKVQIQIDRDISNASIHHKVRAKTLQNPKAQLLPLRH